MKGWALALGGVALFVPILAPAVAAAQVAPATPEAITLGDWSFTPALELRARGEYRRDAPDVGGTDLAGRGGPPVPNLVTVAERVRLGLRAERGQLRVVVTLQDARAWGVGRPEAVFPVGSPPFGLFAPFEAYADLHTAGAHPSFARVGRQSFAWGEGMLLGTADWSPTGTTLDAARGQWVFGAGELEAFAALLAAPSPLGAAFGDRAGPPTFGAQLYGLRFGWAFAPVVRLELTGLARVANLPGTTPDGSRFGTARLGGETFTGSLRVHGAAGPFEYGLEGVAQGGRARGLDLDRRAFGGTARVTYTFDRILWTPKVRGTVSYATGSTGNDVYGQLDPLLPDVHDRFGAMDLFAFSNALTPTVRVGLTPTPALGVDVQYAYARLASAEGEWLNGYLQAAGAPAAGGSLELGHEVDASVRYQPLSALTLQAGYGLLVLGSGARAIMATQGRGTAAGTGVEAPSLSHFAYVEAKVVVP